MRSAVIGLNCDIITIPHSSTIVQWEFRPAIRALPSPEIYIDHNYPRPSMQVGGGFPPWLWYAGML